VTGALDLIAACVASCAVSLASIAVILACILHKMR